MSHFTVVEKIGGSLNMTCCVHDMNFKTILVRSPKKEGGLAL